MAVFEQVKCGRCDRTYSALRGRCPYCGAKRGSSKAGGSGAEGSRWQVYVGAVILLAVVAAAVVLVSVGLKDRPAETQKPDPTAPVSTDGTSTVGGTTPTAEPDPTPTPVPTLPPETEPPATPAPVVNDITLSRSDFTLSSIGETYTIVATLSPAGTAAEVIWISEDPNVCTVDENGMVTAVDHGNAIVSATAGGVTKECIVRVTAYAPTGGSSGGTGGSTGALSLSHSDVTLHSASGESFTLKVRNAGDAAVSFSSSKSAVATVSAGGVVTAVSNGTATITVTVGDVTLECIVRVTT